MSLHDRRGLTFVELLVASLIFSLLLVGLTGHLRGGLTAWRRSVTTMDDLERVDALLNQCTQDFANAVLLDARPDAPLRPLFTADAVHMASIVRSRGPSGAGTDVQWITYAVGDQPQGRRLLRSAQPLQAAIAGEPPAWQPLPAEMEQLAVRYGYLSATSGTEVEWRPSWDDAAHLPRLVEVTLQRSTMTLRPQVLRRLLVIPGGALGKAGGAT